MSCLRNVSAEPPHPSFLYPAALIPLSSPTPQYCHSSCRLAPFIQRKREGLEPPVSPRICGPAPEQGSAEGEVCVCVCERKRAVGGRKKDSCLAVW